MERSTNSTEPFGDYLARAVKAMGLTYAEVARRVGTSQASVSYWVGGRKVPEPKNCNKLAEVLALDPDEVLTKAGHRPSLLTDDDPEIRHMFELVRQLPVDQRVSVIDFLQWQVHKAKMRRRR